MLPRVLEPEVMDSPEEASDYDSMDHSEVNRVFVQDFLAFWHGSGTVLDVGAGTAQIPIELCQQSVTVHVIVVVPCGNGSPSGSPSLRVGTMESTPDPPTSSASGGVTVTSALHAPGSLSCTMSAPQVTVGAVPSITIVPESTRIASTGLPLASTIREDG